MFFLSTHSKSDDSQSLLNFIYTANPVESITGNLVLAALSNIKGFIISPEGIFTLLIFVTFLENLNYLYQRLWT